MDLVMTDDAGIRENSTALEQRQDNSKQLVQHHQYQNQNSEQDTTVRGLDAVNGSASNQLRTVPSSASPESSSHANTLPVHMSSSHANRHPVEGRESRSPKAQQPQYEGYTQQSQQLQEQGNGLLHHKQPTATGDQQQNSPAASLPAAHPFQHSMQQLSAAFEGATTGEEVYDAEEGSPQSEVGLELLGAMAAEVDSGKWDPAAGPGNPGSVSAGAAAGAQAAMAMGHAGSEGAAGGHTASFGSYQKSRGKASNSGSGAANMVLICQVPECGVPLTGAHVSNYFRRHRVCVAHAKADVVTMHGRGYRFCQQCGVLHPIEDFDGQRKSCRVQLDKHNLRRRCRRKSHTHTKSSTSSFELPRGMGGMPMDPYGSFAQAYGMHPNMAWVAGMQQPAGPKRGSTGWGRGVSEDTGEMSRDRDEASNWLGDAADSAQHAGYMHAWGFGPGVPYDTSAVYAAGMAAGAASLPPMMQQQQAASMHAGVGQDGWGMGPGGASAAAAAAGASAWAEGWTQAGAAGPAAAAAAAAGGLGAGGDPSCSAALAAAAAAANGYHPSGAGGASAAAAAAAPLGKGSRVKQEQPMTRPAQQRQGSSNHPGGALDPAAAAAMYMPEAHSGELQDQAAPAAAAGLHPGNAPNIATAAAGVRKQLSSSGGGSSNNGGPNGMGLQQLRLYIAAAIAAGKGPGLTGLRDLGFVQQLLIVDELAHGVLAEMQREQDSPQPQPPQQQQQQQATQPPEPAVQLATSGSVAAPVDAAAAAAAPVAAIPVSHSRHNSSSALTQEQQQQRLKGQLTYHQLPQQRQHQQGKQGPAPKAPTPQKQQQHRQQQQQAAASCSPPKPDPQRPASAPAGPGAAAAAAAPGGAPASTNVPPAALAALMEQIAKYGAKPAAAAAAAIPGSESAAAAAAWQHGSSSQNVAGVKREPSSSSLAPPAQKRPKSAEPLQHLAAQAGTSQGLRQPGSTGPAGSRGSNGTGGSNGGGYGGSNGTVTASPGRVAGQQPSQPQAQQRGSSPGVAQQLQQQLQGQLNSHGGGSVQVAHMLTQLLQHLTAGNGQAGSPAPQQ